MMHIESAESPQFLDVVRELFVEYSESLGADFCFQGFAEELARLPGQYAKPAGRLMLALDREQVVGCGALRPLGNSGCELKRLYVRPAFRGKGAGRALVDALISSAREIGYQRLRLDTLPRLTKAIELYRSLGFKDIPPYLPNPIPGVLYLELELTTRGQTGRDRATPSVN